MHGGPVLEHSIAAGSPVDGLVETLDGAVADFRTAHGVTDAALLRDAAGERYVLQIGFATHEALDEFVGARLARLEAALEALGGDAIRQDTRILSEDSGQNLPGDKHCLNCDTPLRGQYCGQCGQRSQSRLISLWELISDAFGDMFELDSRLWQTLIPLMIRPGQLTADYLKGRRARFMPPFRSYLVLSLLFFVVAFFDPREELAILFPDEASPAETIEGAEAEDEGPEVRFQFDDAEFDAECQIDDDDVADMPGWLQRRMTKERLTRICEQTQIDGGRAFLSKVIENIPAALIVLLPVMALALKILYPLSRRFYVEHLLFVVHFHAFFFLILSLQILWGRLIGALGFYEAIAVLPIIATSLYIPVYLFKAMRRVYGQGFILTGLKYGALVVTYFAGFAATMLGALAFAIMAIG